MAEVTNELMYDLLKAIHSDLSDLKRETRKLNERVIAAEKGAAGRDGQTPGRRAGRQAPSDPQTSFDADD